MQTSYRSDGLLFFYSNKKQFKVNQHLEKLIVCISITQTDQLESNSQQLYLVFFYLLVCWGVGVFDCRRNFSIYLFFLGEGFFSRPVVKILYIILLKD